VAKSGVILARYISIRKRFVYVYVPKDAYKIINIIKYCDGFAQGIAGRQPGGHVLVHAPRNNTVKCFLRVRAWTVAIQRMCR
jgi:hypothetical protein